MTLPELKGAIREGLQGLQLLNYRHKQNHQSFLPKLRETFRMQPSYCELVFLQDNSKTRYLQINILTQELRVCVYKLKYKIPRHTQGMGFVYPYLYLVRASPTHTNTAILKNFTKSCSPIPILKSKISFCPLPLCSHLKYRNVLFITLKVLIIANHKVHGSNSVINSDRQKHSQI